MSNANSPLPPVHLCEKCGAKLNSARIVWLEYDNRRDQYRTPGTVADDDSQGCFPFGPDCARQVRK